MRKGGLKIHAALICVVCLLITACSHSSRAVKSETRSFNTRELDAGKAINDQIHSSFYTYTDPKVVSYVTRVGTELAGPPGKNRAYHFTILYDDKLYATSAPGGYIYVTTGLINFLDNEAELAAILAFEIGAEQFQDPRASSGRQFMEKMTQGVAMASPAFGQIGALAALGAVLVNGVVEHQQVDGKEKLFKSDELALNYMVAAGYDPQGYIDVLRKMVEADRALLPNLYDYYQSHPITEERFSRLSAAFSKLPLMNKSLTVNRDEFIAETRGIKEIYKN